MTIETLITVFRETLGLPPDLDVTTLQYQEAAEWDSLSHLQLVNGIEQAFGLMLETDDVIAMSSFAKAKEIIERYEALPAA